MTIRNSFMAGNIQPEKVSEIIIDTAHRIILPRYNQLATGDIDTKSGPDDLVTIADREAEIELRQALTSLYAGSVLIGEEGVSAGTQTLDLLKNGDSRLIWIADPVDGTWNFVHGKREFCVMLAAVVNGEIRHGWIYDILGKKMLMVEKGGGAYFGSQKLSVAPSGLLSDMNGHAGRKYFPKSLRPHVEKFKGEVKSLYSLSCAGHEYIRIASGQSDFGIYSKIRPWDHFAGTLAVQEAGGFVAKWDGSLYSPRDDFGGLVAASNEPLWRQINTKLIKPMVNDYGHKP